MKKFEYRFNFNPMLKEFILNNLPVCKEKQEDIILELLLNGEKTISIALDTGYDYRTICRRKKDLYYKIQDLLSSN